MRSFDDLTRRGKICRIRQLARAALAEYDLSHARLVFLRLAGNAVFRVHESIPKQSGVADHPFEPGQYLLRVHSDREQLTDAIELEMRWLAAIRRDTGLPVPEPVPNRRGDLLTRISIQSIPKARDCTLLRWLKGRFVTGHGRPHHYRAQGRLMAGLHEHASVWKVPPGLAKRRFDHDGLFRDNSGAAIPASEAWPLLTDRFRKPYEEIARRTRRLMDRLGQGRDVFGMIHADCGVDANLIFYKGEARPIDFDGSGFGYYAFDLAVALEHVWDVKEYPQCRDALLEGYRERRSLPDVQAQSLELFLAAFYVYMGLWETALMHTGARRSHAQLREWQEHGLDFITHYLVGA